MMDKKLILASASPRRKDILANLKLKFEVIPSNIEENIEDQNFSRELIEKLALDKAMDIKQKINYPAVIIGSDTVVVINNKILGKPKDKKDAFNMLKLLSGKTHEVISAIAITDTENNKTITDSVVSKVTFKKLSDLKINNYIATEEPMDKAGAYAIQGLASIFITSICGCYTNIVGISAYKLAEMLEEFDIEIL